MSHPIGHTPTKRHSNFNTSSYWYIACRSDELQRTPKQIQLWGTKIVLFRDSNRKAYAMLDRCPHRNVPLSLGTIRKNALECHYHGWQFDHKGRCISVPASNKEERHCRDIPTFPVVEKQGYLWVYTDSETTPNHAPYTFEYIDNPNYISIRFEYEFDATIFSVAENILDVPHTSFLHAGLFRSGTKNTIHWRVRRYEDRVECEYLDEPRPSGLFGRLLSPKGGTVQHFDRFILPNIAQVDYAMGETGKIVTTSSLSPTHDHKTKMYTVATVRKSRLFRIFRPFIEPVVLQIIKQDAFILSAQNTNQQHFQGEEYTFHHTDVLGPSIMRLMKESSKEKKILYSANKAVLQEHTGTMRT